MCDMLICKIISAENIIIKFPCNIQMKLVLMDANFICQSNENIVMSYSKNPLNISLHLMR